jgi:hypothetical protein
VKNDLSHSEKIGFPRVFEVFAAKLSDDCPACSLAGSRLPRIADNRLPHRFIRHALSKLQCTAKQKGRPATRRPKGINLT